LGQYFETEQQDLERAQIRYNNWLTETSVKIATVHSITDVKSLRELLCALRLAMHSKSAVKFDFDGWTIPKDLNSWKESRAKLVALVRTLSSAHWTIEEVLEDPVLFGAVQHVDRNDRFLTLTQGFDELGYLVHAATKIRGKTGNRPLPKWTAKATQLCREFWRKQMHEEPKRYFGAVKKPNQGERPRNTTTEPGNAFSRWFCDVMKAVARITPSQCDTLLRNK